MEEVELRLSEDVYAKILGAPDATHPIRFRTTSKTSKEIKITEKQLADLLKMYSLMRKTGKNASMKTPDAIFSL